MARLPMPASNPLNRERHDLPQVEVDRALLDVADDDIELVRAERTRPESRWRWTATTTATPAGHHRREYLRRLAARHRL
jgi:hypothetical protein